jgi:hypothetical protein
MGSSTQIERNQRSRFEDEISRRTDGRNNDFIMNVFYVLYAKNTKTIMGKLAELSRDVFQIKSLQSCVTYWL